MHVQSQEPPTEVRLSEAEAVALAYLRAARDDRWAALVRLAEDALADIDAAEATIREQGRRISHGYARGAVAGW